MAQDGLQRLFSLPDPVSIFFMEQKYFIQIYRGGVLIEYAVRGLKRLEAERAILASLVGEEWVRAAASLPITDPGRDFYELSSEQFLEYSNRRVALRRQFK